MRVASVVAAITLSWLAVLLVQIVRRSIERGDAMVIEIYVPEAVTALAVFAVLIAAAALLRTTDRASRVLPWVTGAVSAGLGMLAVLSLLWGGPGWGSPVYAGLRISFPLTQAPFWDLDLVLQSIDCHRLGFDVFAASNGCLADPAIYAPGMLWLQQLPFATIDNLRVLGIIALLISSLALVWLSRNSRLEGQVALLVAAASGSWLLLLERSNVDAWVIWVAIIVVALARRWNTLWAWTLAAVLIWLVGAFKYYPFALGLMLLPTLRLRRGWVVLAGWLVAAVGYIALTMDAFRASANANTAMAALFDGWNIGRIPLAARMNGVPWPPVGIEPGDIAVLVLAALALAWGVLVGLGARGVHRHASMLAIGGSTLYLIAIVGSGFGWAYKSAFLLLTVPLLAGMRAGGAFTRIVMLGSVTLAMVFVWNPVVATTGGILAGAFAFGASATLLGRLVLQRR